MQRVERAASALVSNWVRATCRELSARELAIEFRRALQTQPDLAGNRIRSKWIEWRYPLFCASLGVCWPPPYKDFAKELAQLMPRKRIDVWRGGKRVTYRVYVIPDPDVAVVALSEEKLKRA
jgi:hypothetical protein